MVGEGIPLGRRVQTDHGMEGEGSPLGRRVQTGDETDEEGCELGRRMHATDEQQEEQEEEEISMSGLRPHALEEMVAEMAKNEGFQR